MATDPDARLFDPRDLLRALVLLTRLPVPGADGARGAASAWAWPLVGLIVGAVSGGVGWIALLLGLSPGIAAGLVLATTAVMTGALHEDGLADCADGFWGGQSAERRLEIMKDSRIGAYGVLALIFTVGLTWLALSMLIGAGAFWAAVLIPAALSRGAMAGVMADLPLAREDGLARHVGRPSKLAAGSGFVLSALLAIGVAGLAGIAAIIVVAAVSVVVARLARAKIGGQTGDVLGATQQNTTLAALLALAATLPV
jgi:adenosylcobinamide-GDP ribazoletransferase